jgi:Na+/H+-dicarboxylate symporter
MDAQGPDIAGFLAILLGALFGMACHSSSMMDMGRTCTNTVTTAIAAASVDKWKTGARPASIL